MGVLGLATFVNRSSQGTGIGEQCHLRECKLVVDGSSLAAQLYRYTPARHRSPFNGDYSLIESTFRKFFQALHRCEIQPYVICDGGYDKRKLNTAISRLKSRAQDAAQINPKSIEHSDLMIFPLLLRDVFFHVMTTMKIKFIICEWEADQDIAIVARYLNAPVLSYDSDFYIYNVSYVSLNSINLKSPVIIHEGKSVLNCFICRPGDFAKKFRLKLELLPLLSTLLGNDYVKRATFSRFFRNLSFNMKTTKNSLGQCRIAALLEWFRHENFNSAVEKVLDRFKTHERSKIQHLILNSCKIYTQTYCQSLHDLNLSEKCTNSNYTNHIDDDDVYSDSNEIVDSVVSRSSKADKDFQRPTWLSSLLKVGKLSPRFYELLNNCTYIGTPQVEDVHSEDAHKCAFPILRYSFDLITLFNSDVDLVYVGRKYKKIVETTVYSNSSLPRHLKVKIQDENNKPDEEFFRYFLEKSIPATLINEIKEKSPDVQMLLLTILWMKLQREQNLNDSHVYSLLLCSIMLTVVYNKIGEFQPSVSFNKKHSLSLQKHRDGLKNNINKSNSINKEDCMAAASLLLKYFEVNDNLKSNLKLYDRKIVQSFAEFQCCFQQLSYLNILTSEFLKPCVISKIYNGTFLFNLYLDLSKRKNPQLYILNLLEYAPSICDYFSSLLNIIDNVESKQNVILYSLSNVSKKNVLFQYLTMPHTYKNIFGKCIIFLIILMFLFYFFYY
ncbi:single-strand DNA endonuclease protein asteroid [Arctopsyche grandis]|uniref:single-strand DNA endonuclease protein asteroid n=1 Tax=Arctopsyche grandis TaxID=121162 RepID=UPI00406D8EE5